jgi:hypothetical protein
MPSCFTRQLAAALVGVASGFWWGFAVWNSHGVSDALLLGSVPFSQQDR